ncbi:MAG: DNA-3-methyladenine glycosylase [Saprospiraceae bacterium]
MSTVQQSIVSLAQKDQILANIIALVPQPVNDSTGSVFHDLMSCILEQQIHYRSTKKIFQKLMDTAGLEILTPDNFEVLEAKAFGKLKLAANKYQTILDVLEYFQNESNDWMSMEDQSIRKQLTQIKGISNWTVDMILLYTLERSNIFPADDYHLKQIIPKLYPINPSNSFKKEMKTIAEPWKPQCSLAVKYLFAWKKYKPQN